MISIQKTIRKSLVPVNFIKGLAILYTFLVVAGMVGAIGSQAIAIYLITQKGDLAGGFISSVTGLLAGNTMYEVVEKVLQKHNLPEGGLKALKAIITGVRAGTLALSGLNLARVAFLAILPPAGWFWLLTAVSA